MPDTNIKIDIEEDKMSALLNINTKGIAEEILLAKVQDRMSELKITAPFDEDAFQEKLKEVGDGAMMELIVARGKPPVPPVHGHIEWAKDFFSNALLVVDNMERVDWRERSTSRVLKNGDPVGKMVQPKPGSNGQDIFGNPLIAPKPLQNPYRLGKNVRLDEGTGRIHATADGMVRVTNNVVEIDEVCEVDEVGLESGNIRFPGAVRVNKDVDDLAVIQAESTVEIGGTVGAARIEAEGDVLVGRGISARDKGAIKSKGTVSASFILNADIEAEEGVVARKEIVQSRIRCRGPVSVESGRIVGGETVALGGIVVSEAGSGGNVGTLLVAGEDYRLQGVLQAKNTELAKIKQIRKKIRDTIEPMMQKLRLLSAKQREAVTELTARAGELEEKIASLQKEMEGIAGESQKRAGCRIRILHTLYPGVTLRILGASRHITKMHKGNITVSLDTENNVLVF